MSGLHCLAVEQCGVTGIEDDELPIGREHVFQHLSSSEQIFELLLRFDDYELVTKGLAIRRVVNSWFAPFRRNNPTESFILRSLILPCLF